MDEVNPTLLAISNALQYGFPFALFVMAGIGAWAARIERLSSSLRAEWKEAAIFYGAAGLFSLLSMVMPGWLGGLFRNLTCGTFAIWFVWQAFRGGPPKPPKRRKPKPAPAKPARPGLPELQPI